MPSTVEPFSKVTLPVGVTEPPLTVAVRYTSWAKTVVLGDRVKAVLEVSKLMGAALRAGAGTGPGVVVDNSMRLSNGSNTRLRAPRTARDALRRDLAARRPKTRRVAASNPDVRQ